MAERLLVCGLPAFTSHARSWLVMEEGELLLIVLLSIQRLALRLPGLRSKNSI